MRFSYQLEVSSMHPVFSYRNFHKTSPYTLASLAIIGDAPVDFLKKLVK